MKLVLVGDGDSPHLLKWARALAGQVDLYAISSRGFAPEAEWDALLPPSRRLALATQPRHSGGNAALLLHLPRVVAWLRRVDADWLHAHYLTSHGTLAWLAQRAGGLRAQIAAAAWGSDVLVTPERSAAYRWLTQRVLAACTIATADSADAAQRLSELGAREVLTFPFGLETLPPEPPADAAPKAPWACYANRALEPIYAPERVLALFSALAAREPSAQLTVANEGSLRAALEEQAEAQGVTGRVRFVGRLSAADQAAHYAAARWYLSLPRSDATSVSVLEAMAHGCVPILSDLSANRALIGSAHAGVQGPRGLLVQTGASPIALALQWQALAPQASTIAQANRAWVAEHGLFAPGVAQLLARLAALAPAHRA